MVRVKGFINQPALLRTPRSPSPILIKPGRTFQSTGTSRSKIDPHQKHPPNSNSFAGELVSGLVSKHKGGSFDRLIICAAPAMLSQLKELMPNNLQPHVLAEIPKDLTHIPTDKLASHFESYLVV